MTDIDALIAEVWANAIDLSTHGAVSRNDVYRLLDALTAERAKVAESEKCAEANAEMWLAMTAKLEAKLAKVAALEAEVKRLNKAHTSAREEPHDKG